MTDTTHQGEGSDTPTFTDADELLIGALAQGLTHEAAAALAEVSSKTVQRRMAGAEFSQAVRDRRRQRVAQLVGQLIDASDRAITTVVEVLDSESAKDRLAAARTLLEFGNRYQREQVHEDDLMTRVKALEADRQPPSKASRPGEVVTR